MTKIEDIKIAIDALSNITKGSVSGNEFCLAKILSATLEIIIEQQEEIEKLKTRPSLSDSDREVLNWHKPIGGVFNQDFTDKNNFIIKK